LEMFATIQFRVFCNSFKKIKDYNIKNTVLPVVLYGCEAWTVTLRQEHRLRASKNRALRRIFGPKKEVMSGGWRRLHNEELHNLYASLDIITEIKSRRVG